jgi:hypothetical protein
MCANLPNNPLIGARVRKPAYAGIGVPSKSASHGARNGNNDRGDGGEYEIIKSEVMCLDIVHDSKLEIDGDNLLGSVRL